ncbi:MAG: hypothetical protein JST22_13315 [Bacteroidetes bacterium]|nr:hypothetical protein [Bacteroidota bacterium]
MKYSLTVVLLFMAVHTLSAQETKTVHRVVEIQKEQTFNLTITHARSYVSVDIPPNTIQWFIAFTSAADSKGVNPINLFGQVSKLIDHTGITSLAVNTLMAPSGTARCDVMLTDIANRQKFMNGPLGSYTYDGNASRKNITHGVIQMDAAHKGNWQILLYNPSFTTAVNVTVEVTALVAAQEVDLNRWSQANKDSMFNRYYATLANGKMDAGAARDLAGCVVERICRQRTPADIDKMSRFERDQFARSMANSCAQQMQGGPRTEQQDKASSYGSLGWKAYENGDVDKCIELSKKALTFDSTLGAVKANLGLCYLIKGDSATATDYYVDAITSLRKDRLSMKQHLQAEISDIDEALKKHPDLKGYRDIRELLQSNLPR